MGVLYQSTNPLFLSFPSQSEGKIRNMPKFAVSTPLYFLLHCHSRSPLLTACRGSPLLTACRGSPLLTACRGSPLLTACRGRLLSGNPVCVSRISIGIIQWHRLGFPLKYCGNDSGGARLDSRLNTAGMTAGGKTGFPLKYCGNDSGGRTGFPLKYCGNDSGGQDWIPA